MTHLSSPTTQNIASPNIASPNIANPQGSWLEIIWAANNNFKDKLCVLSKQAIQAPQRWLGYRWMKTQLPKLANQTCEIYLGDTGEASLARCREVLQMQITLNPQQLKRFFQTQVGQTLLTRLSRLIDWPEDGASKAALRKTLFEMVTYADKLSVMSLLYQVSTTLKLNPDQLLMTAKQVNLLLETTDSLLDTIKTLSEQEADALSWSPPSGDDPRLPGPSGVERSILRLSSHQRTSLEGQKQTRDFRVLLYTPAHWPFTKTPVVVISHGFAACPDDLSMYSEHLASHGYVVAIPQHPGSDTNQVREMLAGESAEVFELNEFRDRPLDVSDVLDELERRNEKDYGGRLDLSQVGVIGQSFGGYTALVLAGATIDFKTLKQACDPALGTPNISMLLQCRALALPHQQQTLKDDRVKAVVALDPIGRNLFGPKGIATVDIPVLIITGSEDKAAPMALEPIQLFPWLTSPQRYLAVIKGKSHVHDGDKLLSALKLKLTQDMTPVRLHPPIVDSYFNGLSLAFFSQYLQPAISSSSPVRSTPPIPNIYKRSQIANGVSPTPSTSPTLATHQPSPITNRVSPTPRSLSLPQDSPSWLNPAYTRSISRTPYDLYLISQNSSPLLEDPLQAFQTQLNQLHWQTVTIQHSEGLFNASGGFSLYYQSWLPTEFIEAVVVIVPGLGGHSGLFGNVVKALVPQNYGVYSFDVRGNGRSPGQRGYINSWHEYREDLAHFLDLVQTQHPKTPCFLVGHSMGGLIALDYVTHHQPPMTIVPETASAPTLAGLIVSAPPFGTSGLTGLRLWLGRTLSQMWPRFSLSTGLRHVLPSRDRAVVIAYAHDPLRHDQGTARLATEYLKTIARLKATADQLPIPLLMLHGEADEVALVGPAREFYNRIVIADKTFLSYDGSYHELYDDINHDDILANLTDWLKQHCHMSAQPPS